jgi:hypothetical protein
LKNEIAAIENDGITKRKGKKIDARYNESNLELN